MNCHVRAAGLVKVRRHRHAIVRSCGKEVNKKGSRPLSVGSHNHQECEIHPLDPISVVGSGGKDKQKRRTQGWNQHRTGHNQQCLVVLFAARVKQA